jgi:hypothetical protein
MTPAGKFLTWVRLSSRVRLENLTYFLVGVITSAAQSPASVGLLA